MLPVRASRRCKPSAAALAIVLVCVLGPEARGAEPVAGPDLVLWLDAQDPAGNGRAERLLDHGAALAAWNDKSGRGNHAVQPAEPRRPSFARDAVDDGLHAVHFEAGRQQFFSAGNPPALSVATLTAFVVARAADATSDMWLFSKNRWDQPWTGYGIAVSHGQRLPWPHLGLEGGARGYFQLPQNVHGNFRLVELACDGNDVRACVDGLADTVQKARGSILPNPQPFTVGARESQFLQGDIAEVLVYRRALSGPERRQTRDYLMAKYGLPIRAALPDDPPLVRDWLFQAEGHPLTERTRQEIGWTRQLAARLAAGPQAPDLRSHLAELDRLAAEVETVRGRQPSRTAAKERYLAVRQLKRRILLSDPALNFRQLLLIDQPYPHGSEWPHQAIHRLGIHATPGGRLLVLDGLGPDGTVRPLGPTGPGSYWRPDLSHDGGRVLFCYKGQDEPSFHLFEVGIDGRALRQLTRGDYDDLDPLYLPDGHILFTTTRGNTYVRCGPYIYSTLLARCDADGSNVRLLSQNNEPDFVPSLLDDGRVIYSRWEYTDKSVFRIQSLWTTNPDGTGTAVFWGNQSVWPDHLAEPRQIPGSRRVMFAAVGHHDWFSGSIGIIDPCQGSNFPHGLTRVTADVPWPEVSRPPADPRETPDYHAAGHYTSYKTPYPLSATVFLVSARGEGDKFRLYVMDLFGNRELIHEGTHNVWHAIPLRPRPMPRRLPDRVAWPDARPAANAASLSASPQPAEPGTLYSADVYQGVPDLPRGSVKYLRVFQSDPKTYSTWFKTFRLSGPPVSIVYEESVKRIVSEVPVEADGSVYFKVPAGAALHFQLLDRDRRCVHTMRSFTGVMPGESRGCVGCHESHSAAPPRMPGIALHRSPVDLAPPWGAESIGYERFAQPVLDRYCGKCHQGEGQARKDLDLTLRPATSVFHEPYLTLVGAAGWHNPVAGRGQPGYGIAGAIPVETMDETKNDPRALATLRPRTTLSSVSRLVELCASGKHYDVQVDPPSLRRLMAWVDANCPYMGEEELRALPDPDFARIQQLPIRPRVKSAPVIARP